jgi:hypothetical protein
MKFIFEFNISTKKDLLFENLERIFLKKYNMKEPGVENFTIIAEDISLEDSAKYLTSLPINSSTSFIKPENPYIYIVCPESSIPLITEVLSNYPYTPQFNKCERLFKRQETITYYNAAYIDDTEREFLLKNIEYGVNVMPLVDFLESKNRYTEISLLNGDYFLNKEAFSVLRNRAKIATKRFFDIIYAVILLILLLPIMVITAIAIKLESKGPLFIVKKEWGCIILNLK